jgi:hypothetical protein
MQKIEIEMKKNISSSKIIIRERLKREESYIEKRRIYMPMRRTNILMKVIVKQNRFSSWS